MPLDDREQRILAEIERQFYEEEPELAHAVRNIDRPGQLGIRLPLIGLLVGIVVVVVTFTLNSVVALLGFVLMIASATVLVHSIRRRGGFNRVRGKGSPGGGQRLRRFRRE